MSENQSAESTAGYHLSGKRVLVCEDEAITVFMLERALRRAGMEVIECVATGASAVSIAVRERPDIVLMDLGLQDIDGISAAESILKDIETCLVFLSGHSDDVTIQRALGLGAAGFLAKPIDSRRLVDSLFRLCGPESPRPLVAV